MAEWCVCSRTCISGDEIALIQRLQDAKNTFKLLTQQSLSSCYESVHVLKQTLVSFSTACVYLPGCLHRTVYAHRQNPPALYLATLCTSELLLFRAQRLKRVAVAGALNDSLAALGWLAYGAAQLLTNARYSLNPNEDDLLLVGQTWAWHAN